MRYLKQVFHLSILTRQKEQIRTTSAVINTAVRADCAQARASLPLVAQTQ